MNTDQMTAYELACYIVDNEPRLPDSEIIKLNHDLCLKVIMEKVQERIDG